MTTHPTENYCHSESMFWKYIFPQIFSTQEARFKFSKKSSKWSSNQILSIDKSDLYRVSHCYDPYYLKIK